MKQSRLHNYPFLQPCFVSPTFPPFPFCTKTILTIPLLQHTFIQNPFVQHQFVDNFLYNRTSFCTTYLCTTPKFIRLYKTPQTPFPRLGFNLQDHSGGDTHPLCSCRISASQGLTGSSQKPFFCIVRPPMSLDGVGHLGAVGIRPYHHFSRFIIKNM